MSNSFDTIHEIAQRLARAEAQQRERAIRGAIIAGHDGLDVNRDPMAIEIAEIVPWHRPAPDGDNGYRTTRYTWDWFSEAELHRIVTDPDSVLADLSQFDTNAL